MEKHHLPRIAWEYQPMGRRNLGRPRMRWTTKLEKAYTMKMMMMITTR
jgi:hypothetical protein